MPVLEHRVVAQRERPRADEAHLAAEHVRELRELVEREARSTRPTRVTRGSSRILNSAPAASFSSSSPGLLLDASATIVRNLSIPNSRSPTPIRRST